MNAERCQWTPGCRNEYDMTYLGKRICRPCWFRRCEDETAAEAARATDAESGETPDAGDDCLFNLKSESEAT